MRREKDRIDDLERKVDLLFRVVALLARHRHERGLVVAEVEPEPDPGPVRTADDAIRSVLVEALERNGGNKTAAARDLEVNVKTVLNWTRKYEL